MASVTTGDGVRLNYVDKGEGVLARVVAIDECDHATDLDQPDLVDAAILEFLR
jgi:pimeloyl-ACP methyl ester carboxylesterase